MNAVSKAVVLAALGLHLMSCKPSADECTRRVRELRARVAQIDGSVVLMSESAPYDAFPVAAGNQNPFTAPLATPEALVIDDGRVDYYPDSHVADADLADWVQGRATLLHIPNDPNPVPIYIFATSTTRLSVVRTVALAVAKVTVPRLGFRPEHQADPWRPSQHKLEFYRQSTRPQRPDESFYKWADIGGAAVLASAEGCPQATALAKHTAMHLEARMQRLPDAFEQCKCAGDMDTMAALYWHQEFSLVKPMRWHPYDDKLIEQLGDDATYADLARELNTRYLASQGDQKR